MPARLCPHCESFSNFDNRSGVPGNWGRGLEKKLIHLQTWQCQNCDGLIVLVFKTGEGEAEEWLVYPATIPAVHESVHPGARDDYVEGVRCLGIGAYKAAATMFRRSLQQVMIDKKAPSGKHLIEQVESLARAGTLSKELAEWSHEIRLWGNEGAHPSTDGLDKIEVGDVEQVREFLDRVFEYGYIMPWKLARSRAKRIAKKELKED